MHIKITRMVKQALASALQAANLGSGQSKKISKVVTSADKIDKIIILLM